MENERTEDIGRGLKIMIVKGLQRGYFITNEIEAIARFLLPNFEGITEHLLQQAEGARRLERMTDEELSAEIERLKEKLS